MVLLAVGGTMIGRTGYFDESSRPGVAIEGAQVAGAVMHQISGVLHDIQRRMKLSHTANAIGLLM